MLDRQYQSDLHYLQAHHHERIQAADEAHLHAQGQRSVAKMKDRIYRALGERLIALGQKLKDEAVFNELADECCA